MPHLNNYPSWFKRHQPPEKPQVPNAPSKTLVDFKLEKILMLNNSPISELLEQFLEFDDSYIVNVGEGAIEVGTIEPRANPNYTEDLATYTEKLAAYKSDLESYHQKIEEWQGLASKWDVEALKEQELRQKIRAKYNL